MVILKLKYLRKRPNTDFIKIFQNFNVCDFSQNLRKVVFYMLSYFKFNVKHYNTIEQARRSTNERLLTKLI